MGGRELVFKLLSRLRFYYSSQIILSGLKNVCFGSHQKPSYHPREPKNDPVTNTAEINRILMTQLEPLNPSAPKALPLNGSGI